MRPGSAQQHPEGDNEICFDLGDSQGLLRIYRELDIKDDELNECKALVGDLKQENKLLQEQVNEVRQQLSNEKERTKAYVQMVDDQAIQIKHHKELEQAMEKEAKKAKIFGWAIGIGGIVIGIVIAVLAAL